MMVSQKSRKRKVMPLAISSIISIIKEKEELYAKNHKSDKDIVDTNQTLFPIPKQNLAKVH